MKKNSEKNLIFTSEDNFINDKFIFLNFFKNKS